jgi:hypothetical protein
MRGALARLQLLNHDTDTFQYALQVSHHVIRGHAQHGETLIAQDAFTSKVLLTLFRTQVNAAVNFNN